MNFKSLVNKVSNKFDQISSAVPEIAGQLQGQIANTMNQLKVEGLDDALGKIEGFTNSAKDGSLFASMHPKEFKSNLDAKPGPIGFTTKAGHLVPGESQPPWPNELENFASMNCIITLAALSHKQISDPDNTYRKTGLDNIVCQSGGGAGSKKKKTQVEIALGNNVEFFIDNLDIGANITPSLSYGTNSNATKITFDVLEPYSMGLFYQALSVAAAKAGFQDYTTACFCLQLDFKGWTVDGTQVDVPYARRLIPISLTTSQFSVNEGGSTYQVEAIAWNERALRDSVQQIKTDVAITGRTVREILQTGGKSVTGIMNNRLLEMQQADQVNVADQFVIIFPKEGASTFSPTANAETNNSATVNPMGYGPDEGFIDETQEHVTSPKILEAYWKSIGGSEEPVPENFDEYLATMSGNVKNAGRLDDMMKKYAASSFSQNEIGASKMLDSPFEGGAQPMPEPKNVVGPGGIDALVAKKQAVTAQNEQIAKDNEELKKKNEAFQAKYPIFARAGSNMKLNGEIRTYKFSAGTRLQEIIEEVLITSMYGRELAEQLKDVKDPFGYIKWYRVETDVYTVPTNSEIAKTGKVPSVYTYRIVPYYVHHSVFSAPTAASKGVPELKAQAAKEYNYIYTGKNKDILEFEIAYNKSFIYPITADRGSSTAAQTTGAAGTQTTGAPEPNYKTNAGENGLGTGEGAAKQSEIVNTNSGNAGGSGFDNSEIGIARMFNDRLMNSLVDMVKVNMTIMGDPFYLSDNGVGNYHAKETSYINMTQDGHANYANGELHINVLFRTPIDFDPDKGKYIFPEELIIVDTFSGLYRVNQVNHLINNNMYTTVLQMTRVRAQTQQAQTQNLGAFIETTKASESMNEKAVDYAKRVSDAAITTGATENLAAYKKEIELLLPGYEGLNELVSSQAQSLGLPALDAFGRIGTSLKLIQEQIGVADLGKIGAEFNNLKNAATSFAGNTLSQVNLNGSDVLGKFGTTLTDTVGNVPGLQKLANTAPTVAMQIPNNLEAVATANATKLAKLNRDLKNIGPT